MWSITPPTLYRGLPQMMMTPANLKAIFYSLRLMLMTRQTTVKIPETVHLFKRTSPQHSLNYYEFKSKTHIVVCDRPKLDMLIAKLDSDRTDYSFDSHTSTVIYNSWYQHRSVDSASSCRQIILQWQHISSSAEYTIHFN